MHNRTITLSFFPAFSWQNNEFLSLSRVRRGSARHIHLDNRSSQTSWETYYATVCLHWKSTIRTTTKCFSTSAENAKRDSLVPAARRSVGLWGEIAEETAGCGRSSMVYGVIVRLEFLQIECRQFLHLHNIMLLFANFIRFFSNLVLWARQYGFYLVSDDLINQRSFAAILSNCSCKNIAK